jgi:hypothetical protein
MYCLSDHPRAMVLTTTPGERFENVDLLNYDYDPDT